MTPAGGGDKRVLTVTAGEAGVRLEALLVARTGVSPEQAARMTAQGQVLVDGRRAAPGLRVGVGQRVAVHGLAAPSPGGAAAGRAGALHIHHQDEVLIIVEKPAGLPVQPGRRGGPSLILQLERQLGQAPVVLHRLDADASGLVLLSLDASVNAPLAAGFADHSIVRIYRALVAGRVAGPVTLRDRLARGPVDRTETRRRVLPLADPSGQLAVTHVTPLEELGESTLIEARLETGRTHQIRAQLAHAGHPLAGDRLYGTGAPPAPGGRLFLHAARLGLRHPRTGAPLTVESALPPELSAWLTELRRR